MNDNGKAESGPGLARLWTGLLLSPIIWAVQMQANYTLVGTRCSYTSRGLLVAVWVISLVIVVISAAIALLNWQQVGAKVAEDTSRHRDSVRFISLLGILISATFFLAILMQGLATIVFHPCQL
jgi:hypothetical protein